MSLAATAARDALGGGHSPTGHGLTEQTLHGPAISPDHGIRNASPRQRMTRARWCKTSERSRKPRDPLLAELALHDLTPAVALHEAPVAIARCASVTCRQSPQHEPGPSSLLTDPGSVCENHCIPRCTRYADSLNSRQHLTALAVLAAGQPLTPEQPSGLGAMSCDSQPSRGSPPGLANCLWRPP